MISAPLLLAIPPFIQVGVITSDELSGGSVGVSGGVSLATLVTINLSFMFSRVLVVPKSVLTLNVPDVVGNVIWLETPAVNSEAE